VTLWVPMQEDLRVQTNMSGTGTANIGTTVTTGAASGTKGTPVQLIAATSFDAYWITITVAGYAMAATASEGCLDILAGAATEDVLIPDLLIGYAGPFANSNGVKLWHFPLYIPAGTRLAARAAGVRVSTAFSVAVALYGGTTSPYWPCGGKVTTYGVTVPNGTTIVPGASGAEGAWTQIAASSSEDHIALVPSFQPQTDTTINGRGYDIDIGVGAATEELLVGSYQFSTTSAEQCGGPYGVEFPAFTRIPSGTRLVMRASNSGANDAQYGAALHAVS